MMAFSQHTKTSISSVFYSLLGLLFTLGFFIKSGAAPFHMYKVSIYKGLPLFSVFNYTLIFYITYISYFSYIIPLLVHTTGTLSCLASLLILVAGSVSLLLSLFNNRYIKAFLALSSSLNAISVLLLLSCSY